MIKQISLLTLLGVILTLGREEFKEVLQYLLSVYDSIVNYLSEIFTTGKIGVLFSETLALLLVCALITIIPAFIYWLIFKKRMPLIIDIFAILLVLTSSVISLA